MIQIVMTFGLAALIPAIVRRFGKRASYMAGCGIMAAGGVVIFLAPASTVWMGFGGLVLCQLGLALVNMLVWALEADTVEYGEWKTGVRAEGITYALFSFTRKTGQAVGGALAAFSLAWGGYAAGESVQTASAELGIRAGAGLIPLVASVLAVALMIFYPLTDKRHAVIVAEIAARRAGTDDAEPPIDPSLSTASFRAYRPGSTPPSVD